MSCLLGGCDQMPRTGRGVEALPVFHGPPEAEDLRAAGFTGAIRRMNLNECPYPPSPKAVEAIREAAGQVNRYPDSKWRPFVDRLSQGLGVGVPRIVCGNGSDYLLQAVADVFLRPGDRAPGAHARPLLRPLRRRRPQPRRAS
jgi:histidinol-phosphate aminotransferase